VIRMLPSHSRTRPRRTTQRDGFTLAELLVAMALTLTLMTMLYTAMDLHYRFSTVGQIEVERSQIARSLLSQMAADIRSAVYRPEEIPEEEPSDETTEEETPVEVAPEIIYTDPDIAFAGGSLGLFGDSESIVIHVNRPRRLKATSDGATGPPIGNLQTVSYFLLGGEGSMAASYGDMIAIGSTSSSLDPEAAGVARMIGSPLSLSLMEDPADAAQLTAEASLIAKEIESLQFEYHDGYEWLPEWDSQAEGRLPNAVGIKIRFRDDEFDEQSITRQSASEMTREYNIVVPLSAANPFEALAF
jgi:prepilin-type N-terminal cleavage/methylation domain-containing protein